LKIAAINSLTRKIQIEKNASILSLKKLSTY